MVLNTVSVRSTTPGNDGITLVEVMCGGRHHKKHSEARFI